MILNPCKNNESDTLKYKKYFLCGKKSLLLLNRYFYNQITFKLKFILRLCLGFYYFDQKINTNKIERKIGFI